MRLFTAIDLPSGVVSTLDQLIDRLRHTASVQWSPAGNLHLTTKFVGDWPDARVPELESSLRGMRPRQPIPIRIQGLGFFPNERSPRVFWAGVEGPKELGVLARDTDLALSMLGVTIEPRAFSPHLTLARIKEPGPLDSLRQAIAALPSTDFGAFTADRFYLYSSQPGPAGSVYTKLSEFRF